jgi:hypothetical protein
MTQKSEVVPTSVLCGTGINPSGHDIEGDGSSYGGSPGSSPLQEARSNKIKKIKVNLLKLKLEFGE